MRALQALVTVVSCLLLSGSAAARNEAWCRIPDAPFRGGLLRTQPPPPARDAPKLRSYSVAAVGDSLTDTRVGGGLYLKELQRRCPSSRFDAYGIGGQRTDHMRWRFLRDVFGEGLPPHQRRNKPNYTHVIVLGGVNDLAAAPLRGTSTRRMRRNLGWMYEQARARGVEVVALTVPPWSELKHDRRRQAAAQLNRWILRQGERRQVAHAIDIAPHLSCGANDTLCRPFRRFLDDAIHWGPLGHQRVGALVQKEAFDDCR